jgi:hypothetical protein
MPLFSLVLVYPAGVPLYVARSGDTWGVATGPRDATKYSSVPDAVGAAEAMLDKTFPGQWPWRVGDVEVRVERVADGHAFKETEVEAVTRADQENRLVVSDGEVPTLGDQRSSGSSAGLP